MIGVRVYRGITELVVDGSTVEAAQRKLSGEVPEPNPCDDDLTIWERGENGEWGQVSSWNFDDEEWV